MNVFSLLKNKLDRILNKKAVIIVAVVIVPIMTMVSVLFSEKPNIKETIVLVSDNAKDIPNNYRFKIEIMSKKPAYSSLLLGKYTAIVEEKKDGSYKVSTLKNEIHKKVIEDF
jgi:ABC-2 type transport system permease protein